MMAKNKRFVKVCSCTPKGDIVALDVQVLNHLVKEQEAAIDHAFRHWDAHGHASLLGLHGTEADASTCNVRKTAQRAVELGDMWMAAGCTMKAIQVWRKAALQLEAIDSFWVDVCINPYFVRLEELISGKEALTLGRRIDKAFHLLGHPEMAVWARKMRRAYADIWLDKYYEALP